ncbi:MAG: STN domain-containing protein, partial [Spirosomataceae bacterium]
MIKTVIHFLKFAYLSTLLLVVQQGYSQEKRQSIDIDVINLSFDLFVQELERQTDHHFFYDPSKFDSLQVTIQAKNQPLHAVLSALFKDTDFRFSIDPFDRVFITQHAALITWLPSNPPDS